MQDGKRILSIALTLIILASAAFTQEPTNSPATRKAKKGGGTITPAASPPLVNGIGSIGKIPKWNAFNGYNYTLGSSVIVENNGQVGIGTETPTSKLAVAGTIESTAGGFKFPDGSVQTSSAAGALFSVAHDATLRGDGTAASPLRVVASESLVQPFADTNGIFFDPQERQKIGALDVVPSGKRLIVEHVSCSCTLPLGSRILDVSTGQGVPGAFGVIHSLVPIYLGDFNDLLGFQKSHFAMSQPMKIYLEAGTALKLQVTRIGAAESGGCGFGASGFLVDVP